MSDPRIPAPRIKVAHLFGLEGTGCRPNSRSKKLQACHKQISSSFAPLHSGGIAHVRCIMSCHVSYLDKRTVCSRKC